MIQNPVHHGRELEFYSNCNSKLLGVLNSLVTWSDLNFLLKVVFIFKFFYFICSLKRENYLSQLSVSPASIMCCAVLCLLFVTSWTAACQAPLSMGILQARVLEWVAMPSSRRSFQPRSPPLKADFYCLSDQRSPLLLSTSQRQLLSTPLVK